MDINGTFSPISAARARDNLGVTAELAKKLTVDGSGRVAAPLGLKDTVGSIANANGGLGNLEVRCLGNTDAAFMTFHRGGNFAAYFGLDTDNRLKVGGWSMGGTAYEIWHAGNFDPATKLNTGGGAVNGTLSFAQGLGLKLGGDVAIKTETGRVRMMRDTPLNTTYADLELIRNSSGAPVGEHGHTSSLLRLIDQCDASNTAHWPLCVELKVTGVGSTEHCGAYVQAIKTGVGGGIFGGCFEVRDDSGQGSATSGSVISLELDNTCNGADANDLRIMLDCVIAQSPTIGGSTGANQIGSVFRIGARPGEGSIKRVLRSVNNTPVSEAVIDCTNFALGVSAATLMQSVGQRIAFDATTGGAFKRTLGVTAGKGLTYTMEGTDLFKVSDAGLVTVGNSIASTAWPVGNGVPPTSIASGTAWVDLADGNTIKIKG